MIESLERLKHISETAVNGGYTNVSMCGNSFYRFDGLHWVVFDGDEIECIEHELPPTRSLLDIKRIIKLMELLE